jgi:DNA-binding transcriptional regulator YiaG
MPTTKLSTHLRRQVRDIRAAHGWTQSQLAHAIGVTQGAVSAWERGLRSPSPLAWRALMDLDAPSPKRTDK